MRLIITSLFAIIMMHVHSQSAVYFAKYQSLADSLSAVYKIPSSVILAVAYFESGGGTSKVAQKLHNHFGITGDCKFNISKYKSSYRYYVTIEDSYVGFCKLVSSKKFYESMLESISTKVWLNKIAATGYAADPSKWASAVYNIIKTNFK